MTPSILFFFFFFIIFIFIFIFFLTPITHSPFTKSVTNHET
jgi:hypothetical protein